MEVSERTIYRDIADLQASGVPIDGEAGVGYVMRDGYDLPPLMFTREEVAALALGARLVTAWGGTGMAAGARDALSKIDVALSQHARGDHPTHAPLERLYAMGYRMSDKDRARVDLLDGAARDQIVVRFAYSDEKGGRTDRSVRPLALWFWGLTWTLVAWCELRGDFRMFRVDRIDTLETTKRTFTFERGRRLSDFLDNAEREGWRLPDDPLR